MAQIPRRSFTRLALALIVPLVVLLVAYQYRDKLDFGGDPLRLTAEAPSEIKLAANGPSALPLKLTLQERTGEIIQLSAADPCKVFRWAVQAPGDVFVQAQGQDCVPEEPQKRLGGGETIARSATLMLDTKRYKPGVTYTVFVQLWGEETTVDFRTTE